MLLSRARRIAQVVRHREEEEWRKINWRGKKNIEQFGASPKRVRGHWRSLTVTCCHSLSYLKRIRTLIISLRPFHRAKEECTHRLLDDNRKKLLEDILMERSVRSGEIINLTINTSDEGYIPIDGIYTDRHCKIYPSIGKRPLCMLTFYWCQFCGF